MIMPDKKKIGCGISVGTVFAMRPKMIVKVTVVNRG
jgi:hypothetical protein